jgi:hypothetical protein
MVFDNKEATRSKGKRKAYHRLTEILKVECLAHAHRWVIQVPLIL